MSSAWTVVVSSLRHNCDPESMAGVHWIRCIRLHLFEPREVRLADDKHACWKKRQQKGGGEGRVDGVCCRFIGCSTTLTVWKWDGFFCVCVSDLCVPFNTGKTLKWDFILF